MALASRAPTVSVVGRHKSGKTTFLLGLLPILVARGLRVGCLKHAHAGFEIDHPEKDSHPLPKIEVARMAVSRGELVRADDPLLLGVVADLDPPRRDVPRSAVDDHGGVADLIWAKVLGREASVLAGAGVGAPVRVARPLPPPGRRDVNVSAAVMAGGKSRRMGRDKAWLDVGDGRPIVRRVIDVLSEVADEVFIVANDERYRTLGLRVVPDRFPEGGVLGGIATGIGAATHDRVLVAACDMPFLRAEVFRYLVERSDGVDAVVPRIGGEHETLHALYTKACLAPIERALGAGKMRVISFFDDVRVRVIDESQLRAVDPELRSFTNVNTPEELEAAKARS